MDETSSLVEQEELFMTKRQTFKLDKWIEDNGLTLRINISFIDKGDGTMDLFQFSVSNGCESIDYSDVIEKTTLIEMLKELMH